jgi:threonyl-tRNA synthetase
MSTDAVDNAKGSKLGFFLKQLPKDQADKMVAAMYNDRYLDLDSSVPEDAILRWVEGGSSEGLDMIRHSSAHLLAHAVKALYPDAQVVIGPVIEHGFYYDFSYHRPFTPEDLDKIEQHMQSLAKKKMRILRLEMPREKLMEMFKDKGEHYKVEIIKSIPEGETISLYAQEDFSDVCRGPHVLHTGALGAFKLLKCSGAYWRGDAQNEMLQRIYGTAWATQADLEKYLTQLAERERRDHRRLGKVMNLFHTQKEAPGMVFWHAMGWTIYQTLMGFIRQMYRDKYQEVRTPQLVGRELWEASGHWELFQDNMFVSESEKHEYAVKPMNCPCHVQIYNQSIRSYRDLPYRLGEFGTCHRNEPSGTLSGLMRVRQFVQDDGHIFCTLDQIESEVRAFVKEAFSVYKVLGFEEVIVRLSTRPAMRVGQEADWDRAEASLEKILDAMGIAWELQPGEGAFYGPKLEFSLRDCLDRIWQCGTIQVDFSMPVRLGATYIAPTGQKETPVMLHRAILGSLERFIGILIEHYAGDFPLWLAPVQCVVLNITEKDAEYCQTQAKWLKDRAVRVEVDIREEKISYKIREHVLQKVPYIIVIGPKEAEAGLINVRYKGESTLTTLEDWWKSVQDQCNVPLCSTITEE